MYQPTQPQQPQQTIQKQIPQQTPFIQVPNSNNPQQQINPQLIPSQQHQLHPPQQTQQNQIPASSNVTVQQQPTQQQQPPIQHHNTQTQQIPQQTPAQPTQAQQLQEQVDFYLKQLDYNLTDIQAKNILEQCKLKIISFGNTNIAAALKNKFFSQCAAYQSQIIQYVRQQSINTREGVNSSLSSPSSSTSSTPTSSSTPSQSSSNLSSNSTASSITLSREYFREKLNLWRSIFSFFKDNLKFFNKWRELIYVVIQNINQTHLTPLEIQNEFFSDSFEFLKILFTFVGIEFPPYQTLREVKLSNTHQSLEFQSFIEPYFSRAARLSTLLTLSSLSSTARIVGSSISCNQDNMITYTNQLTESPPFFTANRPLNNKYSIIVQHLLSQSATIEPIKDLLFPQVQSNTLKSKIISIITDATILKTLQLLNKYPNQLLENNITTDGWNEWVLFSDQFCSLVEAQLVDLEQYIVGLSEKRMNNGDMIKDNMVLYLLAKATIIPEIKALFRQDLTISNANNFGYLTPIVISFNNTNVDPAPLNSQHLSLYFFLMRINSGSSPQDIEIQSYFKRVLDSFQFNSTLLQGYKNWWDGEKSKPKQEFFKSVDDITLYGIFCNITPIETEAEVIKFYCSNTDQAYYFPGGIKVSGKIRPVSNLLLLNMSLRCRKKLIQESITILLDKETPVPPAFLEDYNKLVHYTPGGLLQYILGYLKRIEKQVPFHTVLEVISHRLFKVLKSNKELPIVLKTLQDIQTPKPIQNLQLSKSVDFLLLKISNSCGIDLLSAKDVLKTLNIGTILNRRIITSIARLIKIKGISEFSRIQDVAIFIENSYKNYPYMFSKTTLEYFPNFMKVEYEKINHHPIKPPTLQKVQHENQQKLSLFSQGSKLLVQQKQNILHHYQQENNTSLFFCQIFVYVLESKIKNEILMPLVQQLVFVPPGLGNIPITKLAAIFIDFILDEVMVNHLISQNKQDIVKKVSEVLCQWIFKYKIFSLNTIILLLLDRDDNSYSYQILELMLFNSNEFKERVQFFEQQHFRDHLTYKCDDNYFLKNIEFNTLFNDLIPTLTDPSTFSEIAFQGSALPIYYSNTISRFIPIVDVMIGKCIELNNKELLEKLINQFQVPYRYYHDEKESTIKDLLIYYFDSTLFQTCGEIKLLFLKLLNYNNEHKFTSYFNQYLKSNKVEEIPSSDNYKDYFRELITPLADMLDLSNSNVFNSFNLKLDQLFSNEYPNPAEAKLNSIIMEILLLPINQNELVMGLSSLLDYSTNVKANFPNRKEPPSSSMVLSLAIIFAILPVSFHNILIPKITNDYSNEIDLLKLNSPIMKNQYLYGNYSTNVQEKMTVPLEWYIYFIQFYFLYCPLERLLTLNEIISHAKSSVKSISQYYVVLSTVAPLLPRFGAQTNHLIAMVRDVLSLLNDPSVSKDIESKLLQLDSNWLTNENNVDIDFMDLDDYDDDDDDIFNSSSSSSNNNNTNNNSKNNKNNNNNNNNNNNSISSTNTNNTIDNNNNNSNNNTINNSSSNNKTNNNDSNADDNNQMEIFNQDQIAHQNSNIFSNHIRNEDMMNDDNNNVDDNSSFINKEQNKILLKNDTEIIETITDWIYHLKSIVPFPPFRDELYKVVKDFKPIFRKGFKNL